MSSHDTCISGTSRVLTVASLQRLKMGALIPAPANCEVRSVMKFFNAQSIVLIKIHCHYCQVSGHTWFDVQHISCRSSAGRCLIIIHPTARTSRSVISICSYTSGNSCLVCFSIFRMTEKWRWVSHRGSNPKRKTSTTQDTKVGPTAWQNVSVPGMNMLKNSSTLAVSVPINLSIKLGFASVNGPGKFTLWMHYVSCHMTINWISLHFYLHKAWAAHQVT